MRVIFYFILAIHINGLCAQEIRKTIKELPDTGQNTGYTNIFGEDADYAINPPSYTALNNGIVLDNVTGLQWQQTDAGEMTYEQAVLYADTCALGGFTDWRLPSPLEAYSIVHFNRNKPPLNISYFSSSTAEYWWTNSVQYNDPTKVWVTNAGGGIGNHLKKETISAGGTKKIHARVVRDVNLPPLIQSTYIRTDYGSIIDMRTNLEWFASPSSDSITWEQGLQFAEQLNAGSHDDWHMPNAKELFSLTSQTHSSPSVDPIFGITIGNSMYWSSTTFSNQTEKAWYMDSRYGITTYALKTQRLKVIAVRKVQTANSIDEYIGKSTIQVHDHIISIKVTHPNDSISLFDMLGNRIFSGNIQSREWQSSSLSPGAYFIHIQDGETFHTCTALISP